MSDFGNSRSISNVFIITIFGMVICNQWSLMLLLQFAEGSDGDEHFLAIRYFLIKVCALLF